MGDAGLGTIGNDPTTSPAIQERIGTTIGPG